MFVTGGVRLLFCAFHLLLLRFQGMLLEGPAGPEGPAVSCLPLFPFWPQGLGWVFSAVAGASLQKAAALGVNVVPRGWLPGQFDHAEVNRRPLGFSPLC